MKCTFSCLIVLLLAAVPVDAVTVEFTLHPAKAPEPAQKYRLLPKAEEQTDADAVPLYEKAAQLLPEDFQTEQISRWLNTPPGKLPRQQVQSTLQQFKPILQFLEQAAKCKKCDWPYLDDDTLSQTLRKYRRLVFFLALQMRFQINQGRFDKAIGTAQTGFAMAKRIGDGPSLIHGIIGVGIGGFICRQLEQFVQGPNAPNLYWALRGLPRPFIDLTERAEFEDPDNIAKVPLLMNRLDRHVAALQCVEALRLYAAAHDGKFPNELSRITEVLVPNDPVMQKPFVYRGTGSDAVLEAPAPEGATERDAIRYELSLKE
jgi:tetratricopeptide (TPR) repeat protein